MDFFSQVSKFDFSVSVEKLVKTLKINKTFDLTTKIEINEKTRQIAENKQTFDLKAKIEIEKTRQNTENKQTLDLTGKR